MINDYYPLYLHDFKLAEQRLLIEILLDGMTAGVYRRTDLEKKAGINLRHVIGPRDQDLKKRFADKRGRNDVPQAVWAFLYQYVMGTFRVLCAAQELGALLVKIDRLIDMGMKSGRYDNDMHFFNRDHMFLDSRSASVDPKYQDDVYIGFRFNSAATGIVISAMRVRETKQRNVFTAKTIGDVTDRETRGIAYQLNPFLYLFGFLNDDAGGEFYALRPEGMENEILFGIASTVNKDGIAHTKQCCFFKMRMLYATDGLSFSVLASRLNPIRYEKQ